MEKSPVFQGKTTFLSPLPGRASAARARPHPAVKQEPEPDATGPVAPVAPVPEAPQAQVEEPLSPCLRLEGARKSTGGTTKNP